MEQPTCRKLACRMAREAEAGGGVAWSFASSMECLHSGVPHKVDRHSPLVPLCVLSACTSSSFEVTGDRSVWGLSENCSLHGPICGMKILEQPACGKLACWMVRESEADGGEACGFTPVWQA